MVISQHSNWHCHTYLFRGWPRTYGDSERSGICGDSSGFLGHDMAMICWAGNSGVMVSVSDLDSNSTLGQVRYRSYSHIQSVVHHESDASTQMNNNSSSVKEREAN
uniref:Uncharacterized protein n=1 Tax=Eutreptiella gymnastica TaxID=73025 RepID=A0A7S1NPS4_9EUGL